MKYLACNLFMIAIVAATLFIIRVMYYIQIVIHALEEKLSYDPICPSVGLPYFHKKGGSFTYMLMHICYSIRNGKQQLATTHGFSNHAWC